MYQLITVKGVNLSSVWMNCCFLVYSLCLQESHNSHHCRLKVCSDTVAAGKYTLRSLLFQIVERETYSVRYKKKCYLAFSFPPPEDVSGPIRTSKSNELFLPYFVITVGDYRQLMVTDSIIN